MYRRRHDDSGIALFVALLVIFIATVLSISAVAFALHNLNTSSVDRNRDQSIAAAEAGLDKTVYLLQTSGANLPCSIPSGSLSTTPARAQYSVTITYYSTNPPTGSALACPVNPADPADSTLSITTPPKSAEIVSKAYTGNYSTEPRVMQALITLTQQDGVNDAIYGNQVLNFANSATINRSSGSTAPNADLYTNGNYICQNNEWVDGSVYVNGGYIQQANTCGAAGSWEATGNITASGGTTIGGNVVSTGGNVSLSGNGSVGGSVLAYGTATLSSNMTVSGTVNAGDTGLPPVPTQNFPQENYDPTAWPGYNSITDNTCDPTVSGNVYSIITSLSNTSSDTLLYTTCKLSWTNNTSLTINHNLVIFALGGFSMTQNFSIDSTNLSVPHNLELIVPYSVNGTPTACSSTWGNITTSQQTAFGDGQTPSDIDVMLYTPCNITINNKQGLTGQIYGNGTVTINQNWSMTMQQMPLNGAISTNTISYIALYDYKREVSP